MTELVVATLNVNFSDESSGDGGLLKLEIDDREDGLNQGNTSFKPGDDVYFFMFKHESVSLITSIPERTAGGVVSVGSGTKIIKENITFSNSETGSLSYLPDGVVSMTWLGRSLQYINSSVIANTSVPEISITDLKIPNGKKVFGILQCEYETTGTLWKLSKVPVDILEVLLIAFGTTV